MLYLFLAFATSTNSHNGHNGHHEPEPERPVQCRRCRVRLSGVLAGWKANRLLPGYKLTICLACRYELAHKYDGRAH